MANVVLGLVSGAALGGITEGQAVKAERPNRQIVVLRNEVFNSIVVSREPLEAEHTLTADD